MLELFTKRMFSCTTHVIKNKCILKPLVLDWIKHFFRSSGPLTRKRNTTKTLPTASLLLKEH